MVFSISLFCIFCSTVIEYRELSTNCFLCYSSKLKVQLGDHVVIKGERTGRIRYIGHLDQIGQANMVFVGLELDAPGRLII